MLKCHVLHPVSLCRELSEEFETQEGLLDGLVAPESVRSFLLDFVELMHKLELLPFNKDIHFHPICHTDAHFLNCGPVAYSALELVHPDCEELSG